MKKAFDWLSDLTLAQIARLHKTGLITDEMLQAAGLTTAIAKLRAELEKQAEIDPGFRDGLRARMMETGDKGNDA
jgi:hypothetical protein